MAMFLQKDIFDAADGDRILLILCLPLAIVFTCAYVFSIRRKK